MSQAYAKNRQATRRNNFKSGIDATDAKSKREREALRIRKEKRIESFQKRRHFGGEDEAYDSASAPELATLVEMINQNDLVQALEGTTKLRKLLSIENNPPLQETIDAGLLPRLVNFLRCFESPALQFEAAWSLTNIASGNPEQTKDVVESGAVPIFVELLNSPSDDVREQAVWALGNIAGDSPRARDFVLKHGILEPLLRNLGDSTKISMVRNATWTLSNLCRGKPQPDWEVISPALPTIARLLHSLDHEVLTDAAWALSYISDGPNERIQAVIEVGIVRRLVELLLHVNQNVVTPVLRAIGNLVTGDDQQTQIVINMSVLPVLASLLVSPKKGIKKEACWAVSNITAGNRVQVQSVIDAGIFPRLIVHLKNADFDIKKEAAWALSNATSVGSTEQIAYLVNQNLIEPVCDLLNCGDTRIIFVGLEALENLLKVGDKISEDGHNEYANMVEECGGLDNLEALQNHSNNDLYEKVIHLLENYFAAEEDDQNTSPNVASNGGFNFGVSGDNTVFSF